MMFRAPPPPPPPPPPTATPQVEYLFVDGRTAGQNPAAWERYLAFLRETSPSAARWDCERADPLGAYWQRLTSPDAALRARAAAAFVGYELSISKAFIDPGIIERYALLGAHVRRDCPSRSAPFLSESSPFRSRDEGISARRAC